MELLIKIEWENKYTGEILTASRIFNRDFFDGTREYTKEQYYKILYEMLRYVSERNGTMLRMSFDGICNSFFATDNFGDKTNEYTLENIYRYSREI